MRRKRGQSVPPPLGARDRDRALYAPRVVLGEDARDVRALERLAARAAKAPRLGRVGAHTPLIGRIARDLCAALRRDPLA